MKVVKCLRGGDVPEGSVYIGRPGPLGNPFRMEVDAEEERLRVVDDYRIWFTKEVDRNPEFRQQILALRGYDLACWCSPKPCHGDIILAWLKTHMGE